jgi:MFS family permease
VLVGLGLLGVSSLAFAFGDSAPVLDVARFAQGVGGACAWAGGLTWLLVSVPRNRRGQLIGGALAAAVAGILLGPVLGGIATVIGPEPVFVGVAVIAAGLAVWVMSTPGAPRSRVPGLREVARTAFTPGVMIAFWLVVVPSTLSGAIDVLVPLRLDDLGVTGIGIGAVFLVAAAIEATMSPRIGRISDRRGRWSPIRAGLAASTVMAFVLAPLGSVAGLAVAVVGTFLAMSLIWTPAMALLSDEAETGGLNLAFAAALVNLAWAGGHVVGGSALPHFAESTSDAAAYVVIASVFALTSVAVFARRRTA